MTSVRLIYEPVGMVVTDAPRSEAESAEYKAARFGLDGHHIAFRVAKKTPKKAGHFVTLWKRPRPGDDIAPLDFDDIEVVVVHVAENGQSGQFILGRTTLAQKGIMSVNGVGGKRATRIYAPWVEPSVRSAQTAQRWQLDSFVEIDKDGSADPRRVKHLFSRANLT